MKRKEAMEMRGFFTSADENGERLVATKTLMYIWKETNLQANLMSQSSVRVLSSQEEKRNLNTWGRSLSMAMARKPS